MEMVKIMHPYECAEFLTAYAKKKKECVGVVCLNADHNVISKKIIAEGNERKCRFLVRHIFFEACRKRANAIILFHNHPNGSTSPNKEDVNATETVVKGSEYVGIQCLDHIILSRNGYFSFLENDMMGNGKKKTAEVAGVSRTQEVF